MAKHGTVARYRSGCKCPRCRGAQARYVRDYRTSGKFKRNQEAQHLRIYGICPICQHWAASCVDHDPITREVRGRLCRRCNSGLGMFADDKATLERAIKYLERLL